MEYKDGRRPKSSNHFGTEMGLKKTITKFVKAYREYGAEALRKIVDDSIANNYQGVIWDKLNRMPKNIEQPEPAPHKNDAWRPVNKLDKDGWQ